MLQLSHDQRSIAERSRVRGITPTAEGSLITFRTGDGARAEAVVDQLPDVARARRWARLFRRIAWVELARRNDGWRCDVHATAHRLPVTRPIPVEVGLGLGLLGIPVLVGREES